MPHPERVGGRPYVEHAEPGVLIVALGTDRAPPELRDVQMKIAAKAARNGAVLALVTSSKQQARLEENCAEYEDLCDRIHDGTVRFVVRPHSGPWIRDYGPFIDVRSKDGVFVVDAKYDDVRRRQRLEYSREELNERRKDLLEHKISGDDADDNLLFQVQQQSILRYGAELSQLYKDEADARARAMDDDAPYYIAEAALGYDRFELVHSSIFLSGGNLFRLDDGACLTTTDTIAENAGDRLLVESELTSVYRCSKVIFLEALPGAGVIKHIDMFLMPVRNKTLLLASYDFRSTLLRDQFTALDTDLRALVVEAAVVMARNKLQLLRLGYRVTDVPSLLPRKVASMVYFPTLLNGVVQVGRDRRQHLLLPDYATGSRDEAMIKRNARTVFQKAFGDNVDIQLIESTFPAKLQGAVHCLTNSVPYSSSLFARDDGLARSMREVATTYRPKEQGVPGDCIEPAIGEWHPLSTHLSEDAVHVDKSITFVIDKTTLHWKTGDDVTSVPYKVSCIPGRPPQAVLSMGDGGKSSIAARVEGKNILILELKDGDSETFIRANGAEEPVTDPDESDLADEEKASN